MSDVGLGGLNIDTAGLKSNVDRIKNGATNPVAPDKKVEPGSGARLEDPEFMNRTLDGGVSTYDPSQGGFKLRLGGSVTNMPFVDIFAGVEQFGAEGANPLRNPLVQDYDLNGGAAVEAKLNRERWSLGVKVNGAATVKTEGIGKNVGDFADLSDQAKNLETNFQGIESEVTALNDRLQNNTQIQRLNEIITQLNGDTSNIDAQTLNELKTILGSGELQSLLDDVNKTLGKFNSTMADASQAIALLGDGTRSIMGDVAVRGAAEINGGVRTPRYDLGKGWGVRGGVEGAVIIPLPNPDVAKNKLSENGLPEFKSMMAKATTQIQITTTGLSNLSGSLNNIQGNIRQLSEAVGANKDALNNANEIVQTIDPNNPFSVLSQLGNINQVSEDLQGASEKIGEAGNELNKNLEQLSQDLEKVSVKTSMGVTTVTPTAPVGFGIKDIGVTFDGPVGDSTKLRFSTGFLNPYGVLMGEKTNYNLIKGEDEKYKLEQISTEKMNVFHEFYNPAVYGTAGATFNEGKWYRTDLDLRIEQSLTDSSVTRGAAVAKQALGPFSLRTGIMETDLQNPGKNTMFMGGLGVGSIKNPDIFTVDAATNSFTADKFTNTMVSANLNVPF